MKNKKTLLLIVILIVGTLAFFFASEKKSSKEVLTLEGKLAAISISADQTKGVVEKKEQPRDVQSEFKKCFKKEIKDENIETVKKALLQQKDYSPESINEESYEITTAENLNLVVQVHPQDEEKNKVRVFTISKEDGLPDRVKEFPQSGAAFALRLKGALSLGSLKSKSMSVNQTAYDGSLLSIDKKDDKVVRVHLITNNFEFECKNQSCVCLKKE